MSFLAAAIPFVGELAATVGAGVAEATGLEIVGTAAQGGVIGVAGSAIESGSKTIVDGLFGEGSFDTLENFVGDNYTSLKNETELVNNLQSNNNIGLFINKLDQEERRQQTVKDVRAGVKSQQAPLLQGVTEYIKDFSGLVNTNGGYDVINDNETNSTISSILQTMSRINPLYAFISSKLSNSLTDFVIPNNPEYQRVSSIYTGEGLHERNAMQTLLRGGSVFAMVDETGVSNEWRYPEYNTYTVVPPIYGVWTGINSSNNSLPYTVNGQQSFLDKISMLHDIGYKDLGSFNEFSDYQLISRSKYGKDNGLFTLPNELETANAAINYFSTLGTLMRKMFGPEQPLIKEIHEEIYDAVITDEDLSLFKETAVEVVRENATGSTGSSNLALQYAVRNLQIQLD